MAQNPPPLTVHYTSRALKTLDGIWDWNAEKHGVEHADSYVAFLRTRANELATGYNRGRAVSVRPSYRYLPIKRSPKGHGHLVVYLVMPESIEILGFYHTAQDWQGRIDRGEIDFDGA